MGHTCYKTLADAVYELDAKGEKILVSGDKEAHIDGLNYECQGPIWARIMRYSIAALTSILDDIKDDLADFGVRYDQWFS